MDRQQWDARYSGAEFEWSMHPNQFVAAELDGLPPGRALDLAAGEGRNSVWLAERGWSVTAVDFSRVGLEKGRKLSAAHGVGDGQVDWVVADLSEYEPARAAFDLVLIAYLQVDAALRGRVLAGAAAALVPGGTLLVVGHDLANLTEGVGGPRARRCCTRPRRSPPTCPGCASCGPNGCGAPSNGTARRPPRSTPWSARNARPANARAGVHVPARTAEVLAAADDAGGKTAGTKTPECDEGGGEDGGGGDGGDDDAGADDGAGGEDDGVEDGRTGRTAADDEAADEADDDGGTWLGLADDDLVGWAARPGT